VINKVANFLEINKINNICIIVALSGGPDSISLLHALYTFKERFDLEIEAAYVNHGIRSEHENNKDLKLVESICRTLKIKLFVKKIPHNQIKDSSENRSIESLARDIRYNFFDSLLTPGKLLAIGHNRDDQIETMISRFFQGSSIDGLLGIKSIRNNIIRPLIDIEKKTILKYLADNSIEYRIDHTNNELDYQRNKIRHKLLPIIKDIFPGYNSGLKEIEKQFSEIKVLLDTIYKPIDWIDGDGYFYTPYISFIERTFLDRKKMIFTIFDKTYLGEERDVRLPRRFLQAVSKDLFKNGEIILDGYGFQLTRWKDRIIWSVKKPVFQFSIIIDAFKKYQNSYFKLELSKFSGDLLIPNLNFPFIIRSVKNGYSENVIIKKKEIPLVDYNKILIVEKYNKLYAIIYRKEIIYSVSNLDSGVYISID